jgi:hypothetical protein
LECRDVDISGNVAEARDKGEYIGRGLMKVIRGSIRYNDGGETSSQMEGRRECSRRKGTRRREGDAMSVRVYKEEQTVTLVSPATTP